MKFIGKLIGTLSIVLLSTTSFAQDGEGLFKAKCNVCHLLGKDGTGPNLKGVKQKWEDAGEGDLIYEWVKNPQTLVATGNSQMAIETSKFSPSEMTPNDISNEEIDAILDYVENYVPPVADDTPPPTPDGEKVTVYVPNYKKNLQLFYYLLALIGVQVIAIMIITGSMKSFMNIEKNKKSGDNKVVKSIAALIGAFGLMTATSVSRAFTFQGPGVAGEDQPWLLIEQQDIYILIAVNIGLFFLLMHMRRTFMDLLEMIRPKAAKKLSARKQRRLNKMLTDVVPIEEEHTILLEHEYDGIKELDNNLPPWWVWGFVATVVFAVIYIFNFHILKTGDLQTAEYEKSVKLGDEEVKAYLDKMAMNIDESNVTLLTDPQEISAGKTLFDANCVICHNPNGEGNIGPNLTDKNWIYGFDIVDVFANIKNGTSKGMPEHASKLNPVQLQQVASFVLGLDPFDGGKEPEGDIVEK